MFGRIPMMRPYRRVGSLYAPYYRVTVGTGGRGHVFKTF